MVFDLMLFLHAFSSCTPPEYKSQTNCVVRYHLSLSHTHTHPSVRETRCVSESETPPRGGRDAVGRIRRLCVQSFSIFLYVYIYYKNACFIFLTSRPFCRFLKIKYFFFLSWGDPSGRPGVSHHRTWCQGKM